MPTDRAAAEIRELTADDMAASEQLSSEAFGRPPRTDARPLPGATYWGAFVDGQLAAKVTSRDYESHVHGHLVRTCGIGGVTVAAEHRGRGLVRLLLPHALQQAAAGGAVMSGLFPTAMGIYRPYGFEHVTAERDLRFTTRELSEATAPGLEDVVVRRADLADIPALRACYDTWAADQNGPLSRRGVSFPASDEELLTAYPSTFVATAEDDPNVRGYCLWRRGEGFGADASITVDDLVTLDAAAEAALLRTLGSFSMVVGHVKVSGSGSDTGRWVRRSALGEQVGAPIPYLVAILDVGAALELLPAAPGLQLDAELVVAGRTAMPGVPGRYRVTVHDGSVRVERTGRPSGTAIDSPGDATPGPGDLVITPGGLAVWWMGAAGMRELRSAGLVSGPTGSDAVLDALVPTRPVRILDHY